MRIAVKCTEGIEDIVLEEIKQFTRIKGLSIKKGFFFFETDDDYRNLYTIKSAEDVFIVLKKYSGITRYRASLKKLRQQSNFLLKKDNSKKKNNKENNKKECNNFLIKATYIGRRDYKAEDIENAVISGLSKKNKGICFLKNSENKKEYRNKNINANEKSNENANINENTTINIILTNQFSFSGLSIKKKIDLIAMPGSLNQGLANALIRISEINNNDILFDPMCGTGTIPILANLQNIKSIGNDINKEKIKIAFKNNSNLKANAVFYCSDARKLAFPDGFFNKIISNLPFGKEIKLEGEKDTENSKESKEKFFKDFLKEMKRISKKYSIFVFLTRDSELIIKSAENIGLKLIKKINIVNSGLESNIIKLINQK